MAEDCAFLVLASWATHLSGVIIQICTDRSKSISSAPRRVAGEIATRLAVIGPALQSLQPYGVEPSIEELSRSIVRSLAEICVRPHDRSRRLGSTCNLRQIHDIFEAQVRDEMRQPSKSVIISCLCRYEDRHLVDDVNAKCLQLYNGLSQNGIDDTNRLPDNARNTNLDGPLIEFTDDLFEKIQDFAECDPGNHPHTRDDIKDETLWHPGRLCLSEEGQKATSLTFLLSATNMIYWQGFRLKILPNDHTDLSMKPLKWNRYCDHQETQTYNYISMCYKPSTEKFRLHDYEVPNEPDRLPGPGRGETLLSVIRHYLLTPKDKVILAYLIARAYWQFYDSELMRTKWTSESIWFLPRWTGPTEDAFIPEEMILRPYLSFPFGVPRDPLEDVIYDDMLNHKHPRIFRIGILLLEIGLGKPFPSFKRPNLVSQLNLDHQIASSQLAELRRESWAGFRYKSYFDDAVGHCIQSQKLVTQSNHVSSREKEEHGGVLARRKAFYKNVVQPLAWLARKGFRHGPEDISLIRRKAVSTQGIKVPDMPLEPKATFHSRNEVVSQKWLKTLNELSREIEGQRRKAGVQTRIRVALLDTGLNLELPEFADPDGRMKRVQDVKDFVDQPNGNDTFGHGSFMARLVMECAPSADIYVARVARNSTELSRSQIEVQKAIRWAGIDCQADIISMSFGFPKDDDGIIQAIEAIKSKRNGKVIFLASCGNSPTEDENFPARHPSILSIYATDCHGVFLPANARPRSDGPIVLGTYGNNIPDNICVHIEKLYPNICAPGSSVATAVAAGISATMLGFVSVLLAGNVDQNEERKLLLLWSSNGMEALFKKMVRDKSGRQWFVDPISFWKDNAEGGSHSQRLRAIVDCLHEVDRRLQY